MSTITSYEPTASHWEFCALAQATGLRFKEYVLSDEYRMVFGKCRECFMKANQECGFFKVWWRRKGIGRTEEREGLRRR